MVVALGEAVHQACCLASQLCVNSQVPGVRGKVPAGQVVRGCLTFCQVCPQGCQECGQYGGHSASASRLPQIGLAFCATKKKSRKVIINKAVQSEVSRFFHISLQIYARKKITFTNIWLVSATPVLKSTKQNKRRFSSFELIHKLKPIFFVKIQADFPQRMASFLSSHTTTCKYVPLSNGNM